MIEETINCAIISVAGRTVTYFAVKDLRLVTGGFTCAEAWSIRNPEDSYYRPASRRWFAASSVLWVDQVEALEVAS